MKKAIGLMAAMALAASGTAFAQSTIAYELALGGDNQAATYEASVNNYPCFDTTAEWLTDGAVLTDPDVTWSVYVEVSGTHSGGDSDGTVPNGAANLVFNVALYAGSVAPANLVAQDVFFSTINDGDADGGRGTFGPDELHWAAFTHIYHQIDGDDDGTIEGCGASEPGRVIDDILLGGPGMSRFQYPSKQGLSNSVSEPLSTAVADGTLLGMGCGYEQYVGAGCSIYCGFYSGLQYFGVGMDTPGYPGYTGAGLGVLPIAEGQIDLTLLAPGDYVLEVTAVEAANNILEGDFDPDAGDPGEFASQVNVVLGDTIAFTVDGGGTPPVINSADSVRTHGTAGDFAIPILGSDDTECRLGGPSKIVIVFDQDVQAADGTLDTEVTLSSGTINSMSIAGDTLTVNTAVNSFCDDCCLTIGVSGISALGAPSAVMTPATLGIRIVACDNSPGPVYGGTNVLDVIRAKQASGQPVTAANFRKDADASGGVINVLDVIRAKQQSGGTYTAACP